MFKSSSLPQDWRSLLGGARLDHLFAAVNSGCRTIFVQGMSRWALAYAAARLLPRLQRTLLLLTPSPREAWQIHQGLTFFLGLAEADLQEPLDRPLWYFPAAGHRMPAHSFVAPDIQAQRLATLYVAASTSNAKIIVASARAVLEKVLPRRCCLRASRYLVKGEQVDREELAAHLVTTGYYRTEMVEEVGDFSIRGDIIDLFTPLYHQPLRLEFFDNLLESIRLFRPATQRTSEHLEDAIILPAHEVILTPERQQRAHSLLAAALARQTRGRASLELWRDRLEGPGHFPGIEQLLPLYYQGLETLFHYLPASTLVVLVDAGAILKEAGDRLHQTQREHEAAGLNGQWTLEPHTYMLSEAELAETLGRYCRVLQGSLPMESDAPGEKTVTLHFRLQDHEDLRHQIEHQPQRQRLLQPLAQRLLQWQASGISPFLVCQTPEQGRRLEELLANYGVDCRYTSEPFGQFSFETPVTKILVGRLPRGFCWPDEALAVVTEGELYGDKIRRPRPRVPEPASPLFSLSDLQPGDLVVHLEHGIGIYRGLIHLNINGLANDFLFLEYQHGDRLYLPVDRLHLVQKYIGIEGHPPQVDKLGGRRWAATRKRVQESIRKMAQELLRIYAVRQIRQGVQFCPPDSTFREFEASFAFEETPDQQAAIEDVLADMQSSRPMDRLICGDVGFGKTEVALRAAFKAALDGKQVAVLVPTTVLAEQHFLTFKQRLDGYPLFVEVLSRFKSKSEQKKILADLRSGRLDIVIGTHRLLQSDVVFKDLGLLIIDEEHRFGVRHKERIKQLRAEVDVLTLTATPIPRTLHMSLVGIRDLSTINTPPEDRRAIETRICPFDDLTIREAISREMARGGQVFFVHNDIRTIYRMADHLQRLLPAAAIAVAHGQMPERQLEKVMLDFVHHRLDVLVCTTIIESGLDIPAANTIFVNRADKFGLAQIYQLRGRVGRSSQQAYAYLLIPGQHLVTRQAQRRLRALMDFTELGSGFKIALNDLQIRGAGNILGTAQSGHIAAVGYEMYVHLMEKTIAELKGDVSPQPAEPEIHLKIAAHLPSHYIPDSNQRLAIYKRLASAADESLLAELEDELRDRFGPLPREAEQLFSLLRLKLLLRCLWVRRLDRINGEFVLCFAENPPINLDKLASLMATDSKRLRLSRDQRLHFRSSSAEVGEGLSELKNLLHNLD